ncbi:MAG: FkbM family methyltransferase [Bacteroidetes bacterium]|nr:FkbM family methyltransferase [Bacteroidota bacterium]
MPPLVSVILPSYNHAAYLKKRLDSIFNQTFSDFEIIILDDCSTDGSRQILEQYKSNNKIKQLLYNSINNGNTFRQWIKGFNLSIGKYIWIAESDDYCDPNFLQVLVERLEENPLASVAYCKTIQVDENEQHLNGFSSYYKEFEQGRWHNDYSNDGKDEIIKYLIRKNTIPNASAVVFRKDCITTAINQISQYRLSGDWLFWIMLLERGTIHYSVSTINYFRFHTNTVRSSSAGTSFAIDEKKNIWLYLVNRKIISKKILGSLLLKHNIIELNTISKSVALIKSGFCQIFRRFHNLKYRIIKRVKRILFGKEPLLSDPLEEEINKLFSYSQIGEDLIINHLFRLRGIEKPSYIDIGANDPFTLSNTALFYSKGARGINIEANPALHNKLVKYRNEDINLNIGLSDKEEELDFYTMEDHRMSTFSKTESDDLISKGCVLSGIQKVKLTTLNSVLERYCNGIFPDFMSIDVEGLDFQILKTIDFEKTYPKVICVEAAEYSPIGAGARKSDLIDFLISKGYYEYANTNLNAIMVKREFWFI